MLFNSIDFAIFLPVTFALYWAIGSERRRLQNILLLAASYVFYGWWDWRFLGLIIFSSLVDYLVGLSLGRVSGGQARRWLLGVSIGVNLGLLGFFKYFDFFITNLREAFTLMGAPINLGTLEIILPVGISFYTFQTLSYTIDIYRGRIAPTRDPVSFFAFVAFFPQLVAGPIERASNLLPQFQRRRTFDIEAGKDGLRQILLGLFRKVVIADTCGLAVDDIFDNYS